MKELGRFLRLERPRKDSEHEVPAAPSRFATIEEARTGCSVVPREAPNLERFRPEATPEAVLELEAPDEGEPFMRCLHCGADSVRHATLCRQCEARLDTDEVRAFNVRLWAEMTAARARETEELREREAFRRGVGPVASQSTAQTMAAELAAREEARRALEQPSGWASSSPWSFSNSGARLPRFLFAVALGLPVLAAFSRRGMVGGWAALLVVLGALVVLAARRWR